ncbi:CAP domain-containing protein [Paenibacillus sp. 1001270B_150601_E10]|uniref:CAP domain-containing protein n=1 Tax=Paenibacillus sp. 1001270B_150601_E10 TaxID=2787079 RepID=UPI001E5CA184|nr:CAP domain-containing protein [Paenibacillus sp. 1001270B_150601_E10]
MKKQSLMTLVVATALVVSPFVSSSAQAADDQSRSQAPVNCIGNYSSLFSDSFWKQWFNVDLKISDNGGQDQQVTTPQVPEQEVEVTKPQVPEQEVEVTTPQTPQQEVETTPAVTTEQADFANRVVELVNQERAKGGLAPLQMDEQLSKVAMIKAKDMYDNQYFDHQSPTLGSPFDLMRSQGVTYSYAGENIAKGQTSPEQVMRDWMNSEGHRQNIMNPNYKSIGVAFYNNEWVQEFTG